MRVPSVQHGETAESAAAIREQLDRILSNLLFRNSKRYPNLLRYIVERTLDGCGADLKERTLGIEVFGRAPDYDTNLDPVVRITAAEIRKRIAQYYHEPGREAEIRIDLPLGSYVPEFRFPAVKHPDLAPLQAIPPVESSIISDVPDVPLEHSSRHPLWAAGAGVALVLCALTFWQPWRGQAALDDFWRPVLAGDSPILLCIGHIHDADGRPHGVALSDATALAKLSGLMQSRGKTWSVRAEDQATFADLRQGPVVLIGAYNDSWTLRLANSMRFSFQHQNGMDWIADRQNPSSRRWSAPDLAPGSPAPVVNEDYALISRILDPATGKVMVTVGGMLGYGTMAAGEFVTDGKYMDLFAKNAPRDWRKKNLQLVIGTEVIRAHSGPPRLVASYFW